MEGIQGAGRPERTLPIANRTRAGGTVPAGKASVCDVYAHGGETREAAAPVKALNGQQLRTLSEKYDVRNLSRGDYGRLLQELRDSGAITQKQFSDGYSCALPGEGGTALPAGSETVDLVSLMSGLAERCTAENEALADSYRCLSEVFSKIDRFSDGTPEVESTEKEVKETMIEGINHSSAAAYPAAKQVQSSKSGTGFQAVLEQASKTEKAADMPDFSRMTDSQKLAALAKLHDSTDYSGMTDVEKYKLMQDRFEAAFPNVQAYRTGLYGPGLVVFHDPAEQARHIKTIPERICDEQERQWISAGIARNTVTLHREAYYKGMTEEETIAAICKRHKGGTIAARAAILYELQTQKIGDEYAIGDMMSGLKNHVQQRVTGSHGMVGLTYSDSQLRMAYGIANGTHVTWGDVKTITTEGLKQMGFGLVDRLGNSIEKSIDDLLEELMNAEA